MGSIELWHGDCLDLMRNIPDKSIDMVLCDLPYGVSACNWDLVIPFDVLWNEYKRIVKDNSAIVLFGVEPFSSKLRMSNLDWYKYDWIWEKSNGSNFLCAKSRPLNNYENVMVFCKSGSKYNPQPRKLSDETFNRYKYGVAEYYHNKSTVFGDTSKLKHVMTRSNFGAPKSIIHFSKEVNNGFVRNIYIILLKNRFFCWNI